MSRELDLVIRIVAWLTMVVLVAMGGRLFVEIERAHASVADRECHLLALREMQRGDVDVRRRGLDPAAVARLLPDCELKWVWRGRARYLTFSDGDQAEAVLAMGQR